MKLTQITRFRAHLSVFMSLVGLVTVSCGKDSMGGTEGSGARRELPSAAELASNSDMLTIAVKYLAFTDSNGTPVVNEGQVRQAVGEMSNYWRQCNIQFELEEFRAVDPASIGARYSPANYSELDEMRIKEGTNSSLLMIGTGAWNRSGSLGNSGSNCYSSFPGDAAEGLVCEYKSAGKPFMLAHEAGHWLNLRHTNTPSTDAVDDTNAGNVANNLMDHVVAASHDELTPGQCARAREAIGQYRRDTVM